MERPFTTIEEQIKKLEARGLNVSNSEVKNILAMENYYNVVNGYKGLFIDKDYNGPE
ncbi:MAG: hypothetical protein GX207_01835 [Peptococcaceae bacterium]|nr:hypothetical protein [Peptococcaceae bacterium]